MPLVWNAERVKYFNDNPNELFTIYNPDTPEEYSDLNAITKSLVFGSMAVCIGNIKFSTAADFYARWKILEKFENTYLYYKVKDSDLVYVYLTPEVVMQHLGLTTNASERKKTDWINSMIRSWKNIEDLKHLTPANLGKFHKQFSNEFEESLLSIKKKEEING